MQIHLNEFHTSVREERLFCGVLFHLLLEAGTNLGNFVDAINEQLDPDRQLPPFGPDTSIYIEFTYLRDSWFAFGRRNEVKRTAIFDLFSRSPVLNRLRPEDFPLAAACAAFNERFMGARGARIQSDIAYPGQWPVRALRDTFGTTPEVFRELCRVKWSFNIKPDLVILAPGSKPICVEAKLESGEGSYPTSNEECAIFDELFGLGQRRVRQVELQRFMFETLLGVECQPVVVGRTRIGEDKSTPFLTWTDLFSRLNRSSSLPFVTDLTTRNLVLRRGIVPDAEVPPSQDA